MSAYDTKFSITSLHLLLVSSPIKNSASTLKNFLLFTWLWKYFFFFSCVGLVFLYLMNKRNLKALNEQILLKAVKTIGNT